MASQHERDWRSHWSQVAPLSSPGIADALRQVGKTQLGVPVDSEQLDIITCAVVGGLDLIGTDRVLDMGCGNGLVTERVAVRVEQILGIDVSPTLVEDARRFRSSGNTCFEQGDFDDTAFLARWAAGSGPGAPLKLYAYEVLQHLQPEELEGFLQRVAHQVDGDVMLFFGSIPDRSRMRAFYDTPERWASYEEKLARGEEQIGTWWMPDDFKEVVERIGFACEIRSQDEALYTAHYRFDARVTRIGG